MKEKILVTYASKYGSTKEVAEAIADALDDNGFAIGLQHVLNAQVYPDYYAVVLGTPLYPGGLHKDTQNFIRKHQAALSQRPLAMFALGPTTPDNHEWLEMRETLDQEVSKLPWLKPVALEMFGCKYDPALLRFPQSLLVRLPSNPLHRMTACDMRDWDAIRGWAHNLVTRLPPVLLPERATAVA